MMILRCMAFINIFLLLPIFYIRIKSIIYYFYYSKLKLFTKIFTGPNSIKIYLFMNNKNIISQKSAKNNLTCEEYCIR
jgi:hypothetical protein